MSRLNQLSFVLLVVVVNSLIVTTFGWCPTTFTPGSGGLIIKKEASSLMTARSPLSSRRTTTTGTTSTTLQLHPLSSAHLLLAETTSSESLPLKDEMMMIMYSNNNNDGPRFFIIVGVALFLGIAAQSFINSMASGKRGLGAFLQDGPGFQGSKFSSQRSSSDNEDSLQGEDPLPWLKLPNLGFVEVNGQQQDPTSIPGAVGTDLPEKQLENLRLQMNQQLELGNLEEATKIKQQLERLMEENGFEYKADS